MTQLSPASRPPVIQQHCEACGTHGLVSTVFTSGSTGKFRTRRNVEYMRPVLVGQQCPHCGTISHTKTVLQKAPKVTAPVRPDRVAAIKRLKAAGYKFFEWEKVST